MSVCPVSSAGADIAADMSVRPPLLIGGGRRTPDMDRDKKGHDVRLTPPETPPAPGTRASVLHRELHRLRELRDDDPQRFLIRVQSTRESDAVQLLALALASETWTPEQRAAVTARPLEGDADPRQTRAYKRFMRDDRRWQRDKTGPVAEPRVEFGGAA